MTTRNDYPVHKFTVQDVPWFDGLVIRVLAGHGLRIFSSSVVRAAHEKRPALLTIANAVGNEAVREACKR